MFTPNEKRCLEFYAVNNSNRPISQFSTNPPNHVITVFHCEIITRLLQRCQTPSRLHQFTKACRRLTSSGSEIAPLSDLKLPESFEFIDTHFHLDILIRIDSKLFVKNYTLMKWKVCWDFSINTIYCLVLPTMFIQLRGSIGGNMLIKIQGLE